MAQLLTIKHFRSCTILHTKTGLATSDIIISSSP